MQPKVLTISYCMLVCHNFQVKYIFLRFTSLLFFDIQQLWKQILCQTLESTSMDVNHVVCKNTNENIMACDLTSILKLIPYYCFEVYN